MKKMELNIQLFATSNSISNVTVTNGTAVENKSNINFKLNVSVSGATWNGEKSAYYEITYNYTLDGVSKSVKQSKVYFSINKNSSKTFTINSPDIPHNVDGTSSGVTISAYVRITSSTTQTVTKSVSIPTINRPSVLNSFSISIANNETTTITPNFSVYSNSFYNSLVVTAGSQTFTLNGISNGTAITLTTEQRNKIFAAIGTSTSASISAYIVTGTSSSSWNDIGNSASKTATATLPNYTLSITATLSDLNNNYTPPGGSNPLSYFKSNAAQMILNLSSPRIAYTVSSSTGYLYGRTISTSGSVTKTGLSSGSSFNLDLASNNFGSSYTLNITDGRKTATNTKSITVISYAIPTIECVLERPVSTGSTVDYDVSWKYSACSGLTNLKTPTATLYWKLHTDSSYPSGNTKSITISGSATGSISNAVLGTNFNYKQALDFKITIKDKLGYTVTVPGYLSAGLPAFNTYKDNNGSNFMSINGVLVLMASDGSYIPIEVEVVDTW